MPRRQPLRSCTARAALLALGLCAWLSIGTVQAQGVAATATDDSVLLRWSLPNDVTPPNGFVVERRVSGTTATPLRTLVPSPMPADDAVAQGLVGNDEYAFLSTVFSPSFQEDDADVTRAFATLTTIAHPNYARVLGTLVEDRAVTAGTRYDYRVSVADATGAAATLVGSVSITAGATPVLPPVTDLNARYTGGSVHLDWRRPAEETLIAGYFIYRRGPDGTETQLNADLHFIPAPAPSTSAAALEPDFFQDSNVTPGLRYLYRVVGVDLFGRRAPSSEPVALLVPDDRPLEVIAIGSDEVLDNAITLRWTAPDDPRVRGIAVLRTRDPGATPQQITIAALPASLTEYTDETVVGGIDYYYALAAVDEAGRLGPLGPLWAERGANFDPPAPPTGLRLESAEDHLTLRWTPSPEADVAGYRVYTGSDPDAPLETYQFMAETPDPFYAQPVPTNTLRDIHFRVVAVNSSNVASVATAAVSGRVIDRTAPSPPVLRAASTGDGFIVVTWIVSGDPDVQTFEVLRAAGDAALSTVATGLPAGTGDYRDDEVEAGIEYRYAVRAVDASDNVSEPSQPLTARTIDLSGPAAPSGLSASSGDDGVQLAWDAPAVAAAGYVVERARGEGAAFLEISDVLSSNAYLDQEGRVGDRYRVKGVASNGRVGTPSEAVSVSAP